MYECKIPEQELQQLVLMYPGYDPQNPAGAHNPHCPVISPHAPPATAPNTVVPKDVRSGSTCGATCGATPHAIPTQDRTCLDGPTQAALLS